VNPVDWLHEQSNIDILSVSEIAQTGLMVSK